MAIEQNQDQQVTVSIIILTWNSKQQTGACSASLDRGPSEFPSEVIVIPDFDGLAPNLSENPL